LEQSPNQLWGAAARLEILLDEFERSGLSGPKCASLVGIKYQTFAAWSLRRRKLKGSKAALKPTEQVRRLETVVDQAQTSRSQPVTAKFDALGEAWPRNG